MKTERQLALIAAMRSAQQRRFLILLIFILFTSPILLWKTLVSKVTLCHLKDGKKLVTTPENKVIKRFDVGVKVAKFVDLLASSGRRECRLNKGQVQCADVRNHGGTVLRQTQLALVRLLYIFDNICRRHSIKYWLTRGSLLGAVRHSAIIPWDNDLDICMFKQDYEKFRIFSRELPSDVFFQNGTSDEVYAKYTDNAYGKLKDNNGCYGYCAREGCKHHDGLQIDMFVVDVDDRGMREGLAFINGFYLKDITPLKELLFEGFQVLVPNNYEKYLRLKYGDYMSYPREGEQCPTDGLVGIPWASCAEIENMEAARKKGLLDRSVLETYQRYFWH